MGLHASYVAKRLNSSVPLCFMHHRYYPRAYTNAIHSLPTATSTPKVLLTNALQPIPSDSPPFPARHHDRGNRTHPSERPSLSGASECSHTQASHSAETPADILRILHPAIVTCRHRTSAGPRENDSVARLRRTAGTRGAHRPMRAACSSCWSECVKTVRRDT